MFNNRDIIFYNWPEFHYIELEIYISFSALSLLNDNNEKVLNFKRTELESPIRSDKLLSTLNDSDSANYYSQQIEYSVMILNGISQKQRFSMVLIIFSTVENHLKRIVQVAETKRHSKIRMNSVSKIQNYYDFLIKELTISSEPLLTLFNILNEQRHIRNAIAHDDGTISGSEIINTDYGISTTEMGTQLRINDSYVNFLLKNGQEFLEKLLTEINLKISPL